VRCRFYNLGSSHPSSLFHPPSRYRPNMDERASIASTVAAEPAQTQDASEEKTVQETEPSTALEQKNDLSEAEKGQTPPQTANADEDPYLVRVLPTDPEHPYVRVSPDSRNTAKADLFFSSFSSPVMVVRFSRSLPFLEHRVAHTACRVSRRWAVTAMGGLFTLNSCVTGLSTSPRNI
jgi:hypothetical protein